MRCGCGCGRYLDGSGGGPEEWQWHTSPPGDGDGGKGEGENLWGGSKHWGMSCQVYHCAASPRNHSHPKQKAECGYGCAWHSTVCGRRYEFIPVENGPPTAAEAANIPLIPSVYASRLTCPDTCGHAWGFGRRPKLHWGPAPVKFTR